MRSPKDVRSAEPFFVSSSTECHVFSLMISCITGVRKHLKIGRKKRQENTPETDTGGFVISRSTSQRLNPSGWPSGILTSNVDFSSAKLADDSRCSRHRFDQVSEHCVCPVDKRTPIRWAINPKVKIDSHSTPNTGFRRFPKALLSCHSCLVINYIAKAKYAHNPKVGGSNPSPATNQSKWLRVSGS